MVSTKKAKQKRREINTYVKYVRMGIYFEEEC